jgi:hypothetical protein
MFKLFIKLQAKIKKWFMSSAEKACYLQVKSRMEQFTQRYPLPKGVEIKEGKES